MDRFEKLLKQQDYNSLSVEEKEWVSQFVASGDEYESMRRAGQALEEHFASHTYSAEPDPDPSVLKSLQKQLSLKEKEVQLPNRWSVPAWAAMLALVVAGGAGWYIGSASGTHEVYVDRFVTKTDTLRVAVKPDTIVVERVVYRQAQTVLPASVDVQKVNLQAPTARGVNMKEKQDLEKLLVSGGL